MEVVPSLVSAERIHGSVECEARSGDAVGVASHRRAEARVIASIRLRVVEAEDHAVTARAPGLGQDWIDSARAVEEAQKEGGNDCVANCELQSLLLVRGVFDLEAAWVAVFAHATGPRLYVVLDAENARLVRRWRG